MLNQQSLEQYAHQKLKELRTEAEHRRQVGGSGLGRWLLELLFWLLYQVATRALNQSR